MAPFDSLFRTASVAARFTHVQTPTTDMPMGTAQEEDEPDWDDTAWGFYDSSAALRNGLDVTEHTAPPALLGLLHDVARAGALTA